jgi:hypothetical protein
VRVTTGVAFSLDFILMRVEAMTIVTLTDKKRKLPIRAIIRRKGHPTLQQHFLTKAEAKQWESERLREITIAACRSPAGQPAGKVRLP